MPSTPRGYCIVVVSTLVTLTATTGAVLLHAMLGWTIGG
jgi:hypothetical protein